MATENLERFLHVARLGRFGLQIDEISQVFLDAILAKRFADHVFELGDLCKAVDDRIAFGRDGPVIDQGEEMWIGSDGAVGFDMELVAGFFEC